MVVYIHIMKFNEQQTLHFPILGTTAKGKVVMRR